MAKRQASGPGSPSAHRTARALELAGRMPLVHFPASHRLEDWTPWGALRSRKERGEPRPGARFKRLRWEHVFTYAGPCCFHHPKDIGDTALYFPPGTEAGHRGGATPFDSGALEPPSPKLQPWAARPVAERWTFLQRQMKALASWRPAFGRWLAHCYDDPDRYLDSAGDRYQDGAPDRTRPKSILEHNGPRGLTRYAGTTPSCADRRAWTWEVRVSGPLRFEQASALHVPFNKLRKAADTAASLRASGGNITVRSCPREKPAGPQSLYEDSERVVRELIS